MTCGPMSRDEFRVQFTEYLKEKGIENFAWYEVCDVGRVAGDGKTKLEAPSRTIWPNIIPTLKAAEDIRAELRKTYPAAVLRVNSGYRSPDYNKAVGGAPKSLHVRMNALDIAPFHKVGDKWVKLPPELVHQIAVKLPYANKMGIGKYADFTHIDTRGYLGMAAPARW